MRWVILPGLTTGAALVERDGLLTSLPVAGLAGSGAAVAPHAVSPRLTAKPIVRREPRRMPTKLRNFPDADNEDDYVVGATRFASKARSSAGRRNPTRRATSPSP